MSRTSVKKKENNFFSTVYVDVARERRYIRLTYRPTGSLGTKRPTKASVEAISGKKPNLLALRIFGCVCYYSITQRKKKLDERAKKAIFLGYIPEMGCYKVWNLRSKSTIQTCNVRFDEEAFIEGLEVSCSVEVDGVLYHTSCQDQVINMNSENYKEPSFRFCKQTGIRLSLNNLYFFNTVVNFAFQQRSDCLSP